MNEEYVKSTYQDVPARKLGIWSPDASVTKEQMDADGTRVARKRAKTSRQNVAAFWTTAFFVDDLPMDTCWLCGVIVSNSKEIHRSHIIPHRHMGAGSAWNLVLTCADCNGMVEMVKKPVTAGRHLCWPAIVNHVKKMPVVQSHILHETWDGWLPLGFEKPKLMLTLLGVELRTQLAWLARAQFDPGGYDRLRGFLEACSVAKTVIRNHDIESGHYTRTDMLCNVDSWALQHVRGLGITKRAWSCAIQSIASTVQGAGRQAYYLSAIDRIFGGIKRRQDFELQIFGREILEDEESVHHYQLEQIYNWQEERDAYEKACNLLELDFQPEF